MINLRGIPVIIITRYFTRILLLILLLISSPRPEFQEITAPDYLYEARRLAVDNPLAACMLLMDSGLDKKYSRDRIKILVPIYLGQREFRKAASLLDSINWQIDIEPYDLHIILIRSERYSDLAEKATDSLLKGIAHLRSENFSRAIKLLSMPTMLDEYRRINLARAYEGMKENFTAFSILASIDSLPNYLLRDYQDIMARIMIAIDDIDLVQTQVEKLDKPHLENLIMLKKFEQKNNTAKLNELAWKLINEWPQSEGAYYALRFAKPANSSQYKAVGRVQYYHRDYDQALDNLKKAGSDDAVNFYSGMIYYNRNQYSNALKYLSKSSWAAAYYYRGRVYENVDNYLRSAAVYDSLYRKYPESDYATRGLKRKAFLYEDIGDTLKAVETFLKIGEKQSKFRAALELIRIGDLNQANEILELSTEPEYLYWRIRINERVNKPVDSLKNFLLQLHPHSYYNLVRFDAGLNKDTTNIDIWIKQLGDSIITFDARDTTRLLKAIRFFELGENDFAVKELEAIEDCSANDLLYLSRLCSKYGADRESILYALKIKTIATRQKKNLPKDLYRLIYPIRYCTSIHDNKMDLPFTLAMIWQESLFDADAVSSANARGIMQIIPETARNIARALGDSVYNLNDPINSIRYGSYYYREMLNTYGTAYLALAAYNAGPVRVKKWLANNPNAEVDEFIDLIPFNETRDYVKLILARETIYKKVYE